MKKQLLTIMAIFLLLFASSVSAMATAPSPSPGGDTNNPLVGENEIGFFIQGPNGDVEIDVSSNPTPGSETNEPRFGENTIGKFIQGPGGEVQENTIKKAIQGSNENTKVREVSRKIIPKKITSLANEEIVNSEVFQTILLRYCK